MSKKQIPLIRVGTRDVTYTHEDGTLVFRCRLLDLRVGGEVVSSVEHHRARGAIATLELPDGTVIRDVPYNTGRPRWTRPFITSIRAR